jgi:hypothetical protein
MADRITLPSITEVVSATKQWEKTKEGQDFLISQGLLTPKEETGIGISPVTLSDGTVVSAAEINAWTNGCLDTSTKERALSKKITAHFKAPKVAVNPKMDHKANLERDEENKLMNGDASTNVFCFTVQNHIEEWLSEVKSWGPLLDAEGKDTGRIKPYTEAITYIVIGDEIAPETGHRHLQCYGEIVNKSRFKQIFRLLKLPIGSTWLKPRRGTDVQARMYCITPDEEKGKTGKFWEVGTFTQAARGERTDLTDIMKKIRAGACAREIIESHPAQALRYHRNITEHIAIAQTEARETLGYVKKKVIVIHGDSGYYKSRAARKCAEDMGLSHYGLVKGEGDVTWWQGYWGQSCVIIDEFYGWLPPGYLNQLLDGYPMTVPIKGSHYPLLASTIIITTNIQVNMWYRGLFDRKPELKEHLSIPLLRRIDEVWDVNTQGGWTRSAQVVGTAITDSRPAFVPLPTIAIPAITLPDLNKYRTDPVTKRLVPIGEPPISIPELKLPVTQKPKILDRGDRMGSPVPEEGGNKDTLLPSFGGLEPPKLYPEESKRSGRPPLDPVIVDTMLNRLQGGRHDIMGMFGIQPPIPPKKPEVRWDDPIPEWDE